MSLCDANEKLLKGFDKKPGIDDYMRNIKPIFNEIIEKEPEETREQKVKNMLYDVKASEYQPSTTLFIPLAYALIIGAVTIWSTINTEGADMLKMSSGLVLIIAGIAFIIQSIKYIRKKIDYKKQILILFLEEQLLEMRGKR